MKKRLCSAIVTLLLLCPPVFAGDNLTILNGQWRVDAEATMALGGNPLEEGVESELAKSQLEAIVMEILVSRKKIYTTMGGALASRKFSVVSEKDNVLTLKLGDLPPMTFAVKDENTFVLNGENPESSLIFKRVEKK